MESGFCGMVDSMGNTVDLSETCKFPASDVPEFLCALISSNCSVWKGSTSLQTFPPSQTETYSFHHRFRSNHLTHIVCYRLLIIENMCIFFNQCSQIILWSLTWLFLWSFKTLQYFHYSLDAFWNPSARLMWRQCPIYENVETRPPLRRYGRMGGWRNEWI